MGVPAAGPRPARSARDHALAVLRIRGAAFAVALLPAAAAVILLTGGTTGHIGGGWGEWGGLRWVAAGAVVAAVVTLVAAAAAATVIAHARPVISPYVPVEEHSAPELYRLVRDLSDRLDVPAPAAIALTPDCDSWLEDHGDDSPALVIGSPFLWWMRVAELRALLAPVVAGTGPSAHPDIAAARRVVRALDAAAAHPRIGWLTRLLLRTIGRHAAEMERLVASAASARAQSVDYGLRIVAQEQVGLAYAGWDRLLTRVALPAWRAGRWPSRLNAGVVAALTELSRRDRLAEGFASRLGERPACDLLEEPGAVDERVSLLAARLFHGGPAEPGPDWCPVDWSGYPEEVVDRIWRTEAARLFAALDAGKDQGPDGDPTLARIIDRLTDAEYRSALAVRISAEATRAERRATAPADGSGPLLPGIQGDTAPIGFPPPVPRSGRELLADHIRAVVCCAVVDTKAAEPGLDWLDGPALLVDGERRTDLTRPVLTLTEGGDPQPLRSWLATVGVRADKPVRLL